MKKSQVAIEFLVFISVAIVILIGYLVVSSNFMNITLRNKDIKLAEDLVEELKNEINLAGISNNQYEKAYTFPNKINNKDYTISIPSGSREIAIILEGNHYTAQLATEIYEAKPDLIPGEQVYIKKENNHVIISVYIECNEEAFIEGLTKCGTTSECLEVPNNNGCVMECQYLDEEYIWRIKEFCDGAECSLGICNGQIEYYPCNLEGENCKYIYGNQACANLQWTVLGICYAETDMPRICCINPGHGT